MLISASIMIFVIFSTPFSRPIAQIMMVRIKTKSIQSMRVFGEAIIFPKMSAISSVSAPSNRPEAIRIK